MKHIGLALILISCAITFSDAYASCSSASCSINTMWEAQGVWDEPGARLDLRIEYIDQDEPRAGRDRVNVGEIPRHHDEVRTLNRNIIGTFDYTFDSRWGISIQAPYVTRDHRHIHNHMGEKHPEMWDIDALGDLRVIGRYQLLSVDNTPTGFGLMAGLKLPTGDFEKTNHDGELAERTLQPGSGTTDVIAGVYYNKLLLSGGKAVRGFAHGQAQYALEERDHYRPGYQWSMDAGLAYALSSEMSAMLQINALVKGRDRGQEAETEDSGGTFVWFSPGLSYGLGPQLRVYSFVQLSLYQRLNGVQLTADWTATVGFNTRF